MDHERLYKQLSIGRAEDKESWRPIVEQAATCQSPYVIQRLCRIFFRYGLWWAVYIVAHKSTCDAAQGILERWRAILAWVEENPHRAQSVLSKARTEPERLP